MSVICSAAAPRAGDLFSIGPPGSAVGVVADGREASERSREPSRDPVVRWNAIRRPFRSSAGLRGGGSASDVFDGASTHGSVIQEAFWHPRSGKRAPRMGPKSWRTRGGATPRNAGSRDGPSSHRPQHAGRLRLVEASVRAVARRYSTPGIPLRRNPAAWMRRRSAPRKRLRSAEKANTTREKIKQDRLFSERQRNKRAYPHVTYRRSQWEDIEYV
jgi:hypothetical protein